MFSQEFVCSHGREGVSVLAVGVSLSGEEGLSPGESIWGEGVSVQGVSVHEGWGLCTSSTAGGTHPIGMHCCYLKTFVCSTGNEQRCGCSGFIKKYCLVLYVNLVKTYRNFNQSSGNLLARKSNIQREEIHLTEY